jgi:hypothetical protein
MDVSSNIVGILKLLESAFPSIIGTTIGGLITLGAFMLKERADRARLAQEWFEHMYITEGVDRLLSHIGIEHFQLRTMLTVSNLSELLGGEEPLPGIERLPHDAAAEASPVEALLILELLLGVPSLTALVFDTGNLTSSMTQIPTTRRSPTLLQVAKKRREAAYEHLASLRAQLLRTRVKRKSDIYSVQKNDQIKVILHKIDQSNQAFVDAIPELLGHISKGG